MYKVELDLFTDMDNENNPDFRCDSEEELIELMRLFFNNGYSVIVTQIK